VAAEAAIRIPPYVHPRRLPDFVFAFRDAEEIGPRMLARIAKHTGLTASDL
jgi:hypothetical protein